MHVIINCRKSLGILRKVHINEKLIIPTPPGIAGLLLLVSFV